MISGEILASFALALFRALGLVAVLPLSASGFGLVSRLGVAAILAGVCAGRVPTLGTASLGNFGAEFVVGIIIGLPAALVISCAGMWGELFDSGRGQTIGALYDPLGATNESTMGVFCKTYLWAYLLVIGGAECIVGNFLRSFSLVEAGGLFANSIGVIGMRLMGGVAQVMTSLFAVFLPISVLFLVIDCSVGLISKMVPQVSLISESFQTKSWIGLLALWGAWKLDLGQGLLVLLKPLFLEAGL